MTSSNPENESEPKLPRKPDKESEPANQRKPWTMSEPSEVSKPKILSVKNNRPAQMANGAGRLRQRWFYKAVINGKVMD